MTETKSGKCLSWLGMTAISAIVSSAFAVNVVAQDAKSKYLVLELNNTKQMEQSCRFSFLFENKMGQTVDDLGLEVAILDKDDLAQDFLLINSGRLTPNKRRIQQFDLPDLICADIGSVLINDVSECKSAELTAADCLDAIKPNSKINIKLGL